MFLALLCLWDFPQNRPNHILKLDLPVLLIKE